MSSVKNFEDLEIWKDARVLCKEVHTLSEKECYRKDFGLRQQMLNSSGSVMDNIAEGFERNGNKELLQFLFIAKGSLGELRSQLIRSFDKTFLNDQELNLFLNEIKLLGSKMWKFISYLRASDLKGIKYSDSDQKLKTNHEP